MITVRAGSSAIGLCLLLLLAGCSREQQDWRSAEAADTIEGYGQFIQRHPESELATQARTRVAQLGEDRDWQHAGSADTVEAYRDFIAQHPNGKWAQEAHIRIENFSLGEQAGADAGSRAARSTASVAANAGTAAVGPPAAADPSAAGPNATGRTSGTAAPNVASSGARSYGLASPGEAASPAAPLTARSATGSANAGADAAPQAGGPQGAAASATNHPAVPRAAATAPSASSAKGTFGIQLGAFTTEAGANTEWRLLASRYAPDLQGLQEHVVPVNTASGRIYRLQAAVGDEGRARSICNSLRNRGQACVAVLPH